MKLRRAGRDAVLLEVEPGEVGAWQAEVAAQVARGHLAPPREVVPGARTRLVDGVDPAAVRRVLAAVASPAVDARARPSAAAVDIPVVYDGADLAEVARLWGVSDRAAVARHTGTDFRVAFCGFSPGFPYLTGLPDEMPRRATPRTSVPAGSVGLAGRYCGIYPTSSPGGWQLLGTTAAPLFDVDRRPPALLSPGTRVRFVEVTAHAAPAVPPPGTAQSNPVRSDGARSLVVTRPGSLTTVQDGGRTGFAYLGVPRSGFLDVRAARLANRLVGNPEDVAVLECTLDGVRLRASAALTVAVTGAQATVTVDGRPAPWGVAVGLTAGSTLDVGSTATGVRSYVAVAGGVAVPAVLGSRAGDTLSGLGPPPLRTGDVLPVGDVTAVPPGVDFSVPPAVTPSLVLRLLPGPRVDWFGAAGLDALLSQHFVVSTLSNRIGARLTGHAVPRLRDDELESEGMVLGAVQIPPDGQPVVLLADHPTTGGYPVIGVIDSGDLSALAQARPGTTVRFVLGREHR